MTGRGRVGIRRTVVAVLVAAFVGFGGLAATPAGARTPDGGAGGRGVRAASADLLYTFPRCRTVGSRWSDAPMEAVTAIGPGRVRVTGTGVPCVTPIPSDALALVAGTPTGTGPPITFVYYTDAHPFTAEVDLPVGTTRVCTAVAPGKIARCFGARVDPLPDGSPAVPVVGADLGIRPPLVTRTGPDTQPHCGGCW